MKLNQKLTNSLLLFFTPVITGLNINASPTLAATLALSESQFSLYNFTHSPQSTATFAYTDADTFAYRSKVQATGYALAAFFRSPSTIGENQSYTLAMGTGQEYGGMAQSLAVVKGENFVVEANETFSFDFRGFLELYTSIDAPPGEGASADGSIFFQLYNSMTGNLLDYFGVAGNLVTSESGDFLGYDKSKNVNLNPDGTHFYKSFGGNEEVAFASLQGSYSRTFDSLTYLTLVEVKTNQSIVKAPEPSNTFALILFCLIALGYNLKSRASVREILSVKKS